MPVGEFAMITKPEPGKFVVEVSAPIGLISHTAPGAHWANVVPTSFLKVSSGLANVRARLVNVPGGTLAVLRKTDSVSSRLISICIGPLPLSRSTLPGLSVAPVRVTSNDSKAIPAAGVSVIVNETVAAACGEADVTVIIAEALLALSFMDVAVRVTVAGLGTAAGAL